MVEKDSPEPLIGKQCKLLSISRSSFRNQPKGETALNLMLRRQIDVQFVETPFFGVRQMVWHLRSDGHLVNEKRMRRLMRLMGLTHLPRARYQQARQGAQGISLPTEEGARDTANQVWTSGIAYVPMRRGFLYLVVIIDRCLRKVLARMISNTLEAEFRVEDLDEAINKYGMPEIVHTDQGNQSTSFVWTDRLRRSGVRIFMGGKGWFLDKIFAERLWRSLKHECVYLHVWETGSEARAGNAKLVKFYHHQRSRSAHGGKPPAVVYWLGKEGKQLGLGPIDFRPAA